MHANYMGHSFIFSNWFILVRVSVDLEPILVKVGVRQEYTLDGTPVHHQAPCIHIHILSHL